ncbi:MAG: hypothetical protein V3S16_12615 [Candidatus Desulfatibia sp.]|uniref:hypothetical protein n=1 Tax=Candidatus Desulfatibia sp. TaxID=3101189 RepID=UPI002F2DEF1C
MLCNGAMRMIIVFAIAVAVLLPWPAVAEEKAAFDISAIGATSSTEGVQWHGYYEFHYIDQQEKNSTFDAHKIVVWMGVPLNDVMFLSAELEYEHFPRLEEAGWDSGAGDIDKKTGGRGEMKVDSAQLSIMPFKGFRGYTGIFYVPFGIEYFSYPGNKNKLVTRPKVMKSGGIIPGTWADVGIGFNNLFEGIGHLDVFYLNGDAKNGGVSRDSSSGGNQGKSLGARIMLDDLVVGLNIGASYVSGKWDENDMYQSTRTGIHLRIDSDKIFGDDLYPVLLGEFVTGKDEGAAVDTDKKGYYVQISSRVHPLAELVARYGVYDNDEKTADNEKKETSFGVVMHLLDNFQLKAEYQINNEEGTEVDNNKIDIELVAWW